MKPDTHHCFSTSTLVRSLNQVMLGFTLPTDSQARFDSTQPNLQRGAIALEDIQKNSAYPPETA
jgi:aspartyl/asparaginyl beta-hydroxylase (cupin superfamily)